MTAARAHPLALLVVVGLFLFWVVQDPVGAAAMIRTVFETVVAFLELLAERVVQFLGALM